MRRITIAPDQPGIASRLTAFFVSRGVRAYAAGGFLRDALLGRPVHDLDIAVEGDSLALGRALADELAGAFVALDDERGHARVVLPDGDVHVDLTPLDGAIEDDLRGRDYTVDAIGAPLEDLEGRAEVIDTTD